LENDRDTGGAELGGAGDTGIVDKEFDDMREVGINCPGLDRWGAGRTGELAEISDEELS
jgi:hypothetical protein